MTIHCVCLWFHYVFSILNKLFCDLVYVVVESLGLRTVSVKTNKMTGTTWPNTDTKHLFTWIFMDLLNALFFSNK